VVLDLGDRRAVRSVELVPEQRAGAPFGAPVDVRVQVSDDPTFATSTLLGGVDDHVMVGDRIEIHGQGAAPVGRYVRVLVPELGDTAPGLKALVLEEVRIFG